MTFPRLNLLTLVKGHLNCGHMYSNLSYIFLTGHVNLIKLLVNLKKNDFLVLVSCCFFFFCFFFCFFLIFFYLGRGGGGGHF